MALRQMRRVGLSYVSYKVDLGPQEATTETEHEPTTT